ncbi:hypothetical protein F8388_001383 [Cannabis sativa]|uniref:N-acetyltransferase domain-containing protein n=1 Tax=Cannabis sativa TaxID=3483 RepID=A0A7J6GMJ3_CANSA|nr:hypothetical protein F8388_001383 [Cannabis sativa]
MKLAPANAVWRPRAHFGSRPSLCRFVKDLNSRGFILRCTPSDLNLDNLNKVFVAVGFPKRDTDNIRIALENTDALLWIEYEKTQRPVAFARATGDRVFNAIIWDVVVDPSFQGFSLGKAVMARLIDQLLEKGIMNIALYSEPRVLGFYKPMGFVADLDGIRGMSFEVRLLKRLLLIMDRDEWATLNDSFNCDDNDDDIIDGDLEAAFVDVEQDSVD